MARINKNLFLTLKQDISELNKLNDDIKLNIKSSIDITWICRNKDVTKSLNTNPIESNETSTYVTCLEYIVDRYTTYICEYSKKKI